MARCRLLERFAKRLPPPRVAEPAPGKHSVTSRAARPTIYIDVSDLLLYLLDHSSLSGIQRVQCEVVRHLADAGNGEVDFVALEDGEGLVLIEAPALLEIIDLFRSGAISRTEIRVKIISMMNCARRCLLRDSDIFLTLGAFWGVRGAGRLLQQLKNSGVVIGLFIHDIIPITHPEYFSSARHESVRESCGRGTDFRRLRAHKLRIQQRDNRYSQPLTWA